MDGTSQNNQIAETQELDSQMISQQFFTCEDYVDVWGTLKDSNGEMFCLKSKLTYFGREAVRTNDMDVMNYIFNDKKVKKSVYERISKSHFTIERKIHIDPAVPNYEPAIITCTGRNGLTVGNTKLALGDKRILKDGDGIFLPSTYMLFHFSYTRSEEGIIEKSCKIHEKFYVGEIIGRGGCGEVRRVINIIPSHNNGPIDEIFDTYAIKCLAKPKDHLTINKEDSLKGLKNEISIMRQLNYVHVLKLFEVYETPTHVFLLFPYMRGGDLLTKILKSPLKYLLEDDAKFYFIQLVYGVKYLHSKGITHRDIKPDNVLLTDRGDNSILMLADFGLSKMNGELKTQCGTEIYVAPEIIRKRGSYTNAVDIWSAGVLLYAMISGKMPFTSNQYGSQRENILACKFDFLPTSIWNKIPTAKSIINFMLQQNPRNRLSADQLASHKWLKDEKVKKRLEVAYSCSKFKNIDIEENDSLTSELEMTMVNVSINEEEVVHPPKRLKVN